MKFLGYLSFHNDCFDSEIRLHLVSDIYTSQNNQYGIHSDPENLLELNNFASQHVKKQLIEMKDYKTKSTVFQRFEKLLIWLDTSGGKQKLVTRDRSYALIQFRSIFSKKANLSQIDKDKERREILKKSIQAKTF